MRPPERRRRRPQVVRARAVLLIADTLVMVGVSLLGWWALSDVSHWGPHVRSVHLGLILVVSPVWGLVFLQHRLYTSRFVTRMLDESRRLAHGVFVGVVCMVVIGGLLHIEVSRPFTLFVLLGGVLGLSLERWVARAVFKRRRSSGTAVRPVLIVGTSVEALALHEMLRATPHLGYQVVGYVDDDPDAPREVEGVRVYRGVGDTVAIAQELGAQGVIVASSALTVERSNHLVRQLSESGLHVEITWPLRDIDASRLTVRPLGRFPVAYVEPVERYGWRSAAKRAFDIGLTLPVILLTLPVLALAALAVKFTSPGPVLFRQERVGRWGRPFKVLKLRTMVVDAEARLEALRQRNEADGPLFKMQDDPRITPVGRFLRKTSIDELPQLFNVLRGEMSLVGPRPALPAEAACWGDELHNRLRVKPGITGMWQVSGRSMTSFADYERLDLYYVDNWSVLVDLAILVRTIPVVLTSRGAC